MDIYARKGDDSDVLAFARGDDPQRFVCQDCLLSPSYADGSGHLDHVTETAAALNEHLAEHVISGDRVPLDAFQQLQGVIMRAMVPTNLANAGWAHAHAKR